MPHATEDEMMGEGEETAAFAWINQQQGVPGYGTQLDEPHEIDQTDKAENAVDFGDISDDSDDLPDEEQATNQIDGEEDTNADVSHALGGLGGLPVQPPRAQSNGYLAEHDVKELPNGDKYGESDEMHDLFGEHSSSPEQHRAQPVSHAHPQPQPPGGLALPSKSSLALPGLVGNYQPAHPQHPQHSPASMSPPSFEDDGYSPAASLPEDDTDDEEGLNPVERMQRQLFKNAARKQAGEQVDDGTEEIDMDVFYNLFPSFEKNQNPNFVKLFPPRPATYRGKAPLKPPRPVLPTKVSLDLMPDQEKIFKTPGLANKATDDHTHDGLIHLNRGSGKLDDSDDDLALGVFDENERIGGVTMQDLAIICGDWDLPSDTGSIATLEDDLTDGEWEAEELMRPRKKQKRSILDSDFSLSLQDPQLPFEDPERATAKLAKSITLDLNDPHLLIDELVPQQKSVRDVRRDGAVNKDLAKRYNISNDEAYDLLKENHQHKVRSTLGGVAVEHSMPAARLQYPFYKFNLDPKSKRSFHRPHLDLRESRNREFRFQRLKHMKRKHLKGRETKDIFAKSEDLHLGDSMNVLLLEYSEEAPMMMSNFGMGNKLVNWYRKRDADDQERPKREIGDTQVLLTQDKSPFANFGHVDRGEVVPTIQNPMYRAPVFQHKPKSTDFLVGLSSTYQSGHRFYLRNIENLHVVGQQFPYMEVPGEHSRKVTDAAKKRLRALSFRIYTKSIDPTKPRAKALNNENLMPHLPGHDMPQTRSKMREFMKYERAPGKESGGVWVPQPGSVVPDAETLRGWIKPEEVCLLDSMQVGVQHLKDLGITEKGNEEEENDLEEGAHIERQLAPWRTTKNFLQATQGKAMLQMHGEGDPTGRGEGFSFVKTSMKGGYTALGESAQDKIDAKKRRENGGHTYNVARQQKTYEDDIRMIWNKQKQSLSATFVDSDEEMEDEEPEANAFGRAATPRSSFGTPAAFGRHEDESASQFSRGSADRGDRALTVTRKTVDKYGHPVTTYEKVTNPRVIALYRKRRLEKQLNELSTLEMNPTGNAELDRLQYERLQKELSRVTRNADRRVAREKAKGKHVGTPAAGSPGASEADGANSNPDGTAQKGGRGRNKDGTQRKCANCGQVGHIKTNRKSVKFSCLFCDSTNYKLEDADRQRLTAAGGARGGARTFLQDSYSVFKL